MPFRLCVLVYYSIITFVFTGLGPSTWCSGACCPRVRKKSASRNQRNAKDCASSNALCDCFLNVSVNSEFAVFRWNAVLIFPRSRSTNAHTHIYRACLGLGITRAERRHAVKLSLPMVLIIRHVRHAARSNQTGSLHDPVKACWLEHQTKPVDRLGGGPQELCRDTLHHRVLGRRHIRRL